MTGARYGFRRSYGLFHNQIVPFCRESAQENLRFLFFVRFQSTNFTCKNTLRWKWSLNQFVLAHPNIHRRMHRQGHEQSHLRSAFCINHQLVFLTNTFPKDCCPCHEIIFNTTMINQISFEFKRESLQHTFHHHHQDLLHRLEHRLTPSIVCPRIFPRHCNVHTSYFLNRTPKKTKRKK